jgi:DNA-binding MarR family transcriptional regulator/GNAT superfamily N-acetyltransferase
MSPSAFSDDIAVFRRFNRMYTRFIGTLQEGLLNTEYNLAEARILYELGTRSSPRAKDLAETLGLDPGYLSRLLAKFERSALLRRKAVVEDSRAADLILTARGRSAFRKLNDRSDCRAGEILQSLTPGQRTRLIHSMREIERVLNDNCGKSVPYVLRAPRMGDMGCVVARESAGYADQYGWNEMFESLVARIVADFLANFNPARERCWIADQDGESLGHVFLVQHPDQPDTAKLRLLFVEPAARGKGLGHALVAECVRFARVVGYRKIVLWTQSILVAAQRIYQGAGFRLIAEEPHHSFGMDLIAQTWELELGQTT